MADKKADIKPLNKLRGRFWVTRCMQVAGVRKQARLHALQVEVSEVALWSKYMNGFTPPPISTVRALDKRFKGTAKIWIDGPYNLPFWAVLKGDLNACTDYLKDYLNENADASSFFSDKKLKIRTLSLESRIYMLIRLNLTDLREIALQYSLAGETPPWEIEAESGGIAHLVKDEHGRPGVLPISSTNLAELVSTPANLLEEECLLRYNELQALGRTRYDSRSDRTPLILRYGSLLAFIAGIHLCRASQNKTLQVAADYMRTGIDMAIARQLSEEVSKLV